ncbi:MAG: tRNA preQ1(34) S-adenosylmethionine ribosyltransferase-isomerase QueA [Candidatus Omnitrophica bacterium]|nr:tRNA preQ1(34) S-adenosylmethionine ribosyltransferase-isomerase QueA [Candidatus Omnitrophota bacterium]
MKLSEFDYNLPKELIARYPLLERDEAKLLVLRRQGGQIEHSVFKDITGFFSKGDLLVLNNTRVLNCRLLGRRSTGGKVEVLLLNQKQGMTFNALLKPGRLKLDEKIIFDGQDIYCRITSRNEVTFSAKDAEEVYKLGVMPLPPYIKRNSEQMDDVYYQTVYAEKKGSVAAPTAGLHFTESLLRRIKDSGVNIAYVTLHISYATFKSIKSEDITEHKMDREYFEIDDRNLELIENARAQKARIFAVGTTSCRVLESYAATKARQGYTDLFIYPGYKFKLVNCLLTNFHLPRTTLLLLVSAFAGKELADKSYQQAIEKKYRFYSYGDAMLII